MTDGELEAFRDAVDDLGDRVTEILADGSEMTPDEIEAIVEELETADG